MRILNSFSMGRSSARLSALLPEVYPGAEIVTVTANTGQEMPESVLFGKRVDEYLGLKATLVEAVVHPEPRKGTTHRVVTWDTAYFGDAIFESMIAKYGIPNVNFPHCTRELKDRPITSYLRSIGWEAGSYKVALGIRADEPDRVPVALGGKKKTQVSGPSWGIAEGTCILGIKPYAISAADSSGQRSDGGAK